MTRATIDETRWVGAVRLQDLEAIVDVIPAELAAKTHDDVLTGFLNARRDDPSLTPKNYLSRFDQLPELLRHLEITLDDRGIEQILATAGDCSRESEIVNSSAIETRGWGKTPQVIEHDICHYKLVEHERSEGRQAWFLTRDGTLLRAANRLSRGGPPFCFPLIGFLQSISPFVESTEEEVNLADLFSAALDRDFTFVPEENLFDLRELKIITDLHADVLSTPVDQLVVALDFVKNNVLDGQRFDQVNHTKVALELKKFISSTAEEREQALLQDVTRQKSMLDSERRKRADAEADADHFRRIAEEREAAVAAQEEAWRIERLGAGRATRIAYAAVMLLGSILALATWMFESSILSRLLTNVFEGV